MLNGFAPYLAEVLASQLLQSLLFKGIKLEVYLKIGCVAGQALRKLFVLGYADAIGIEHQVFDGLCFRDVEDFKKLRVHGWLAAADLHYVGLTFISYDGIEHLLYFLERAVPPITWRRHGITGG